MIGQRHLLDTIDALIANNKFPRFCILVGPKGSGKKKVCEHINEALNTFWCYEPDNKVETIRSAIVDAYKVVSPTCYVFTDVDNMSVQAKNSLLKVTEEPPNSAYFIMTIENLSNTLETIISRATVFHMDNYTPAELLQYAQDTYQDNIELYGHLCDTPGEVDLLYKSGTEDFYHYVEKVVNNISIAPGCNVFKITSILKLKEEGEGYDIKLFLKAFIMICGSRMQEADKYIDGIIISSNYLSQLGITGISKQSLLDMWILDIRKAWM